MEYGTFEIVAQAEWKTEKNHWSCLFINYKKKKKSGVFESFHCLFSVETKTISQLQVLLTLEVLTAAVTYCCQLKKKKGRKRKSQRLQQMTPLN